MTATQKRPPEASLDDEGEFTVVCRRSKRAKRRSQPQENYTTESRGPLPEWRLVSADFPSQYQAIRWMEEELKLRLRVTVSPTGDFIIRAWDWSHAQVIEELAAGQARGIILVRREPTTRGVLLGYPVQLPLDPVLEHPSVAAAERCLYNAGHGRRVPTRSLRLTLRGPLPASLDLGCWGRYACRRYVPEPIRCFRCQAYGHHQRHCKRASELCGACSGEHATRDCPSRLRDGGERPAPLCANCGARHHAWNRRCPARLRRISGAVLPPRETLRRPPRPTTPAPAAVHTPAPTAALTDMETGRNRRRRRRRRRKKTRATEARPSPPPAPEKGREVVSGRSEAMDEDPTVPAAADGESPHSRAAVAERPEDRGNAGAVAVADSRCSQGTQTQGCFVFSEAELVDLLIRYEHLLDHEKEAQYDRISHEPALSCVRRHLRAGEPVPRVLPTEQALLHPPRFRDHRGEGDWVTLVQEEMTDDDEALKDLLLNADRDLTEDELARIVSRDLQF